MYNNLKNVSKLLNDTKIINLDGLLNENIKQDIDNIYLYVKHQYEEKYRFLINKRKSIGLKHFKILRLLLNTEMIPIIFIKIFKSSTQRRIVKYYSLLIISLLICLDIKSFVKFFIRGRKLYISLVFVTQS